MKKLLLNKEQYNVIKNKLANKKIKITEKQLANLVDGLNTLSFDDFIVGIKMIIGTEKYEQSFMTNFYDKLSTNKVAILSKLISLNIGTIDDETNKFIVSQNGVKEKLNKLYNWLLKNEIQSIEMGDVGYMISEDGEDIEDFKIKKFYKNGVYLPKPFNIVHRDDDNTYCILKNSNDDYLFLDYSTIDKKELVKYSGSELDYQDGKFTTNSNNIYDNKTLSSWFDNNYYDIEVGIGLDGYNSNNCVVMDNDVFDKLHDITKDETLLNFKKSDILDETTTAMSSGSYEGPAIWASNKSNHMYSQKPAIPGGKIVKFDDCTKLNNNKVAQKGGCSQGAIDNVVKY
jgi:hypothetical protein